LEPLDPGYNTIEFQYVPEQLTRNISSNWGETKAYGRFTPIQQFASGELETIEFTARLFAETILDNIAPRLDALIGAVKPSPKLGRPPIWQFVWGGFLDEIVIVESIGGINYDDTRSEIGGGLPGPISRRLPGYGARGLRSVTLRVVLRKFDNYTPAIITTPSQAKRDTYFHTIKSGETWETLAHKFYGDAVKGELLRRLNPSMPFLEVGSIVVLVRPQRFRGAVVLPNSIPLRRTPAGIANRHRMFQARGKAKKTYLLEKS